MTVRLLLFRVLRAGESVAIDGAELHYLVRVRRVRIGDEVELCGAEGARFGARVTAVFDDRAELQVGAALPPASRVFPVILAAAVPKGTAFDDVVRRASELGVERLVPILTERSVAVPGASRIERWHRIAAESLRQCGRGTPLAVDPVRPFAEAILDLSRCGRAFVLHPRAAEVGLLDALLTGDPASRIAVAVGPEGGFIDAEIALATRCGMRAVALGTPILRAETAAVAAAVVAVAALGGL